MADTSSGQAAWNRERGISVLRTEKMAREDANQEFAQTSFLYAANAPYLEDLQARYARDPASVDAEWRAFFEQMKDGVAEAKPS